MFEDVPALNPVTFFKVTCAIAQGEVAPLKKPYLLQDMSDILNENPFADVAMAWNAKGLLFTVKVHQAFKESFFPNIKRGDSIELFIDTRNLKSAGSVTRFCHHFVFFPKETDECVASEITRMRADDSRPLADPQDLYVSTDFTKRSYTTEITISRDALYGYDPDQFKQLGLTYRINRAGGYPQHFALSSHEYALEKHPALWATGDIQ